MQRTLLRSRTGEAPVGERHSGVNRLRARTFQVPIRRFWFCFAGIT